MSPPNANRRSHMTQFHPYTRCKETKNPPRLSQRHLHSVSVLNASEMCQLLDECARHWRVLSIDMDKYIHCIETKFSTIQHNSERFELAGRSGSDIFVGIIDAIFRIGCMKDTISSNGIFIWEQFNQLYHIRDRLTNVGPVSDNSHTYEMRELRELIDEYARVVNVNAAPVLNARETCELINEYSGCWRYLSDDVERCVRDVGMMIAKILYGLGECISGLDQGSKKMILCGVENVIRTTESMNVKILDMKTRLIPPQLNQLTALFDRLNRRPRRL